MLSDARRWSQQLERIDALSRKLSRSRDVHSVAEAVASEIASVIDWHGLRFFVVGKDEQTLEAVVLRSTVPHYAGETPEKLRIQIGKGLAGAVAATRVGEIVPDVRGDARGAKIPDTDDVDESMIVVPLVYEDRVLGVLQLIRLGRDAFDGTDLRLAEIVGAQAAVALSNARQLEELERRGAALERRLASQRQLLAITERLVLTRDQNQIFDAIADTLADVVPHDTLTIYLVDRAHNCLVPQSRARPVCRGDPRHATCARPRHHRRRDRQRRGRDHQRHIDRPACGRRARHAPGRAGSRSSLRPCAAWRASSGRSTCTAASTEFDDDDLELVKLFANHVAIALENAAAHERLISAAVTDPLTGLPNRRLFADRIEHALARRSRSRRPNGRALPRPRPLQARQRRARPRRGRRCSSSPSASG